MPIDDHTQHRPKPSFTLKISRRDTDSFLATSLKSPLYQQHLLAGRPTPAIKALCSVLPVPPSSKHISPLPPPFTSESNSVSGAAFSPVALSCSRGGKCSLDSVRLDTYVHTERLLTAFLRCGQCHVSPVGHCIDEARSKLKDPG